MFNHNLANISGNWQFGFAKFFLYFIYRKIEAILLSV